MNVFLVMFHAMRRNGDNASWGKVFSTKDVAQSYVANTLCRYLEMQQTLGHMNADDTFEHDWCTATSGTGIEMTQECCDSIMRMEQAFNQYKPKPGQPLVIECCSILEHELLDRVEDIVFDDV